jgi:hypothetical protein
MSQGVGSQGLASTVSKPPAQLQGPLVLADGTAEVAEGEAKLAELLPGHSFESGITCEQGLGPGERLEGRFVVVQAFALELAQAEEGFGPAPRQAEVREATLRALIGGNASMARLWPACQA